ETPSVDLTAVAATADGQDILEADVTATVNVLRTDTTTKQLVSDDDWANLLLSAGYTADSIREYVIRQMFALPILVLNDAAAKGITPDETAIDNQISEQKTNYSDEASWITFLNSLGFATEAAYRTFLEANNIIQPLLTALYPDATPTEAEIDDYLTANSQYLAGRRSSAIVVDITTDVTAETAQAQVQAALDRVNAGEDFGAVADEVNNSTSITTGAGGDVGWAQLLSTLPSEYTLVLNGLNVGDVSSLVATSTAVFVVKCTDEYTLPADGSFDVTTVPQDLRDQIATFIAANISSIRSDNYFQGLIDSDRITINPMPDGLPYYIDLTLVSTDVVVGDGAEAQTGDTVSVTYVGTLADGTVFDSSDDHGGSFEFVLGQGSVIRGWDQGVVGMKVGGQRTLVIPPALGYGSAGSGSIPGGAYLTFQITLLAVTPPADTNTDNNPGSDQQESNSQSTPTDSSSTPDSTTPTTTQ
ncbi:MAG: FKBP-type peptidyl-prolyl cis-trans isomerase, partial [Actinomycetia bacterium]|nr:FKBP-type peptidyl-prolyl cis-trans isomerase [Actinomycetes bacterium]